VAYILGIETSCDETAAAVVKDGSEIVSNIVSSQAKIHETYGGVFPEVASRQHILHIVPVLEQALTQAQLGLRDMAAIAVTSGPGLAGSLLVGVNMAKGLALASGLPLIAVNHLEAHIYANWLDLEDDIQFPLVCLITSGGHTNLVLMTDHGQYQHLGQTLDDAAGEAFDKVARLLGLGYPGGPEIQRVAEQGDPATFDLPRAWLKGTCAFSFSGLKTAVLYLVREYENSDDIPVADMAASFQAAVVGFSLRRPGWRPRDAVPERFFWQGVLPPTPSCASRWQSASPSRCAALLPSTAPTMQHACRHWAGSSSRRESPPDGISTSLLA